MVGEGPRLRLRLSPVALDQKPSPAALDVAGELDRQMEGNGYVELELELDGRWTGGGMSTLRDAFCGWCQSAAQAEKARTRVANGRVTGTIKASHTDDPKATATTRTSRSTRRSRPRAAPRRCPRAAAGRARRTRRACGDGGEDEGGDRSSCFTRDDAWLVKQNLDYFEG